MAVRPIRLFGDPVLRTSAQPVTDFDLSLRNLVKDLTQTLDDEGGSGLAAPQVGVGLRVFVFDVDGVRGHLVNPGLGFPDEEEEEDLEGCLSFPGLYFDVKRRRNVVARGVNEYGDPLQVVGADTLSRCLQHETDHLRGLLFVDHLPRNRRRRVLRDMEPYPWNA